MASKKYSYPSKAYKSYLGNTRALTAAISGGNSLTGNNDLLGRFGFKPGAPEGSLSSQTSAPITNGLSKIKAPEPKKKSILKPDIVELLDKLNVPLYALVGATESLTGKGNENRGFFENIKHNIGQREAFGDYLKKYGVGDKKAAIIGFAADVLLDPLNFAGLGFIGKGAKIAEKAGVISKIPRFLEKSVLKAEYRGLDKLAESFNPSKVQKVKNIIKGIGGVEDMGRLEKIAGQASKITGEGGWDKMIKGKSLNDARKAVIGRLNEELLRKQGKIKSTPGLIGLAINKTGKSSPKIKKIEKLRKSWFGIDPGGAEKIFRGDSDMLRQRDSLTALMADQKDLLERHVADAEKAAKAMGQEYDYLRDPLALQLADNIANTEESLDHARKAMSGSTGSGRVVRALEDWTKGKFNPKGKYKLEEVAAFPIAKKSRDLFNKVTKGGKELDFLDLERFGASAKGVKKKMALSTFNTIGQAYGDFLHRWKRYKTLLNVGTHTHNILGNIVMTMQAGVNVLDPQYLKSVREAFQIISNKNHRLYDFFDKYVDLSTHGQTLLNEMTIRGASNKEILRTLKGIEGKSFVKALSDNMGKIYASEDSIFKMAYIIYKDKKYGGNLTKLAKAPNVKNARYLRLLNDANEIYLNYAKMPQFVKLMRTAPFGSPFISFMYGYGYRLGRLLKNSPAHITVPIKGKKALGVAFPERESDLKAKEKMGYLKSDAYGKVFESPSTGSIYYNFESFFPMYSLAKQGKSGDESGGFNIPFMQDPVTSTTKQLITGKNFYGQPIFSEAQNTAGKKLLRLLGFGYQQVAPTTIGYYPPKIYAEFTDPSGYGDPLKKIMGMFGFNYERLRLGTREFKDENKKPGLNEILFNIK